MDGGKSYNTQSEIPLSYKEKYNHNIQRQMDRTVENTKYIIQPIKNRCCKLSLGSRSQLQIFCFVCLTYSTSGSQKRTSEMEAKGRKMLDYK